MLQPAWSPITVHAALGLFLTPGFRKLNLLHLNFFRRKQKLSADTFIYRPVPVPGRPSPNTCAANSKTLICHFLHLLRALSQVSARTDRWTHRQPHGSTLTSANSRESILNDTNGIHRVDSPLMQIGGGLQMKDGKINKAVGSRLSSSVRTEQPQWDTHSNEETEGNAPVLLLPGTIHPGHLRWRAK